MNTPRMLSRLGVLLAGLAALLCTCVAAEVHQRSTASVLSFEFVGSGFHQQLRLRFQFPRHVSSKASSSVVIHLPKAFIFDIPEVLQMHSWELDGATAVGDEQQGRIVSMSSEHVFDIEAPIFRIPYEYNTVQLTLKFPSTARSQTGVHSGHHDVAVLLPIHTRYETVDADRPFAWSEFMRPIDSFVEHCISADDVHGQLEGVDTADHVGGDTVPVSMMRTTAGTHTCVKFPRGILSHLPIVYWLTMGLLGTGALLVMLVVR